MQPEDDHTPAPGTICFVTGQGTPGGAVGEADVDGGNNNPDDTDVGSDGGHTADRFLLVLVHEQPRQQRRPGCLARADLE